MISILIFLYGLIFGSFYNVVGLRVPAGKSIVKPRSACSLCGSALTARDLVPVFSYLFLKGRCRNCGAKISIVYPLTELLTALLFLYAYFSFGFTASFWTALALFSMLVIIIVSDFAYMIIPDKVLLFFGAVFIFLRIFHPLDPWWDSFLGAAIGFSMLLLIAIASKGGMGGGDIKLFAVLGFVMGTKLVLLTLFLSCVFGTVFGLLLMIFGIVKRGKPMPFGPYIAAAAIVSFVHGSSMIGWYLQFF